MKWNTILKLDGSRVVNSEKLCLRDPATLRVNSVCDPFLSHDTGFLPTAIRKWQLKFALKFLPIVNRVVTVKRDMESLTSCLYGDADRRDRILFEFHAFSIITVSSLVLILFNSSKLRRIYLPLYYVVNSALALQLISDLLYFFHYPYSDSKGNCPEVFIQGLYVIFIAFGELHQVYFIANVLGLNNFRFSFGSLSFSLETFLRMATISAAVSIFVSVFVQRFFMMAHDIWALIIVFLQIYFIRYARKLKVDAPDAESLIDANNDAVTMVETISWLQVIPLCVALADRVLEFDGIFLLPSLDGVMLIVEFLGTYLFYIKMMILQEKANMLSVEVHRV